MARKQDLVIVSKEKKNEPAEKVTLLSRPTTVKLKESERGDYYVDFAR